MSTTAGFSREHTVTAHWMSKTSRAGVILRPSFHDLKTNRASQSSGTADITSYPFEMLHFSNSSCSVSEDSLHEEKTLESDTFHGLLPGTTETTLPAHLGEEKQILAFKDATGQQETEFIYDKADDWSEADYSDPLLQKLEQLKEFQQQKQEQLKRQQMEQLQRLMEEQQKLLTVVSGQQATPCFTLLAEDQSQRYEHTVSSTSATHLPSVMYQNHSGHIARHLDDFSSEHLQKLNNECILSLKSHFSANSVSEKQHIQASLKPRSNLKNSEEDKKNTGKSIWCLDKKMGESAEGKNCNADGLHSENADFSEGPNGRKCLQMANTEERPIKAGIQDRKQTFEEFLEEQIQLEEQRLKKKEQLQEAEKLTSQKQVTKWPFLKRGEGLSRFTKIRSKVTKYKEGKVMFQLSTSEDRNIAKAERPHIQRKTVTLSKELVSENSVIPSKRYNQTIKTKNGPAGQERQTMVLKNHNGKTILPSKVAVRTEKNLDEQFKESCRSEINNKLENKENIMEFAKSIEIGSKYRSNLPHTEKYQVPTELTKTAFLSQCSMGRPAKDLELCLELSFQNKLENWEKEKEKENMELDEFLFLEQAADEISFSSNSSFVQRILEQDQQLSKGRRMSSTPIKTTQQQMNTLVITAINNKNKVDNISQGNKNDRAVAYTVSDLGTSIGLKDHSKKTDNKIFQISSTVAIPNLQSTEWNINETKGDESNDFMTESEEELETTLTGSNENDKKFLLGSREDNPEFCDRGPVKDTSKESKSGDADLDLSDKDYSSDESIGVANQSSSKVSGSQRSSSSIYRNNIEFDDDRTWSDLEENVIQLEVPKNGSIKIPLQSNSSNMSEVCIPDKALKRKVASIKRGDDLPKERVTDNTNIPPTSDLMMKLFPSLKPKQKAESYSKQEDKSNAEQEESGGDTVRSQVLREKLVELETEIERFRAENASLTKLRQERECALENLRKEIADFEQQKTKELARLEEFKKEEMRKLQKERKVFEKYATAARAIPDKKERDEIQALKQQIADLQEDLKRREAKWSSTQGRLRNQIEALTKENAELREEIRIMERFRLEAWKKESATESKRKAESCGIKLKREESMCPPVGLQKCQILSPVPPTEKCSKMSRKSYSPAKGKPSRRPKSALGSDLNNGDKTMLTLEDSSRTFTIDVSPNGTCESKSTSSKEIQGEINYPDGKVEKILKNGCHLIFFPNGTRKEVSSDGKTITVTFFNGDVKQVMPDQTVIYYYADAKTTHTTYPDGLEVLHFSNGQIEKHYPDGRKEITFPDQTIKNLLTDGQEESIFPNGTIVRVLRDGSKTIEFNNGQRELHTLEFKRREYPDGTVKTVYVDGRQETKYVCGRIRVKDKDGNIIMDTKL
ncbi:centromere protein J isoform X1 [Alligator sinensis]|uniref:Centrosomal P4.1-associated protein n=2 Tax=Alligator sinensis TaxID=38654 RepID=A0A1U7STE0_ALLSI|nr:centromere protein J isoform X1 [Alligator sinensis]XP_025048247.1 centromere protein J isoform X1 [Alligator sinensis]